MEGIQWWGYRHKNGTLHLKRYFGPEDIQEASESPFVDDYAGPWRVDTREQAEEIAKKELKIQ